MELLQEALESQAEITKVQKVALLSHLKALNRDNSALIRQSKQNAAHQAQLSDNVHAKVQNLLYERRHLEQEIERCRNFKTTYDKLPLISLEEYNSIQRDEESMKDNDEHTLMLNRLRHELNTRRELSDRRKELQDIRSAVNSENNATKNSLEDLDSDLDKFVDVSISYLAIQIAYISSLPGVSNSSSISSIKFGKMLRTKKKRKMTEKTIQLNSTRIMKLIRSRIPERTTKWILINLFTVTLHILFHRSF